MKKILIAVGAALAVAVIPAAAGFAGNEALSGQVEVRTGPTAGPVHKATPKPSASHDVGDDKGGHRPPGGRTPEYGDDRGARTPGYGDDKSALRQRDDRRTGDDKGSTSGRGRGHGTDDGAGHR